ncbi:MAG: hypothetical protein NTZ46_01105 [Verrucomicrobia bacterium]|nr:hypothetical protein [Verrucomicrobiota bacterium]
MPQDAQPASPPQGDKKKQTLRSRILWFVAGSVVNYLFIATPFKYLRTHTGLSVAAISACSIGLSTSFFFLWNYFINFKGDSRRRDALARYVVAVVFMWALSSLTLTLLKYVDFHFALSLPGGFPIDLDIVATQLFIGGFKFFVYHRWVFPVHSPKPVAQESAA